MKKLYLLTLFFSISCFSQSAPQFEWEQSGTSNDGLDERAKSILPHPAGGFIVLGSMATTSQNHNLLLIKLEDDGDVEWEHLIESASDHLPISIIATADGGFMAASDHGLYKLTVEGDVEWYEDYYNVLMIESVIETNTGDFVMAGSTYINSSDFSVLRVNSVGGIIWQTTFQNNATGDTAFDIIECSDDNFAVVGDNNNDFFITKLNSVGGLIDQQFYGGSNTDYAYSFKQTDDGGFIIGGYSDSNDEDVIDNHGDGDIWIIKVDSDLDLEWQKNLGGSGLEYAFNIILTSDGGFLMTGLTLSQDGDVAGNEDLFPKAWFVKLSTIGEIEWQKLSSVIIENSIDVIEIEDGYVFASTQTAVDPPSPDLTYSYWCGKIRLTPLFVNEHLKAEFIIYPNPTSDVLNIQSQYFIKEIIVNDISGKKIVTTINSSYVDTSALASGLYLITASTDDKSYQSKFIKQ